MIDLTTATTEQERLALQLLASMEDGTLFAALDTLCTDDFEWANSGLPTLRGRDAIREFQAAGGFRQLVPILNDMRSFSADVHHLASRGDIVFTERTDHHWDGAGRDLMTPRIAGVIEIRGNRVCALRDYYDVACYEQEPTEPDPDHALV